MSGVHCSFNSARHMDGCVVHLVSPLKHIQFTVYMKFQLVFLLSDEQRRIASSFRLIALAHSKRIECFCSRWSTTSSFQLNKRTNELFTSLLPTAITYCHIQHTTKENIMMTITIFFAALVLDAFEVDNLFF